mgnify:CR=1 FL=1
MGIQIPVSPGELLDKLTILSQLYQRLVEIHDAGKKAVVLIDEAQMLATRELMAAFEQTGGEHLHGLFPVLELRAAVLAPDDQAGGDVEDLDGGVGRVHALTALTAGAVDVDSASAITTHGQDAHGILAQSVGGGGGAIAGAGGIPRPSYKVHALARSPACRKTRWTCSAGSSWCAEKEKRNASAPWDGPL